MLAGVVLACRGAAPGAGAEASGSSEVRLPKSSKKVSGWNGNTLRREALKRENSSGCGRVFFMQPPAGVAENEVGVVLV